MTAAGSMDQVTVDQFKAALLAAKRMPSNQMKMLKAHYQAPGRRLTATQLAAAAHYDRYSVANLQYGALGKAIGEFLGVPPAMRHRNGDAVWTSYLATGNDADVDAEHYVWEMRPALAQALTELPWGFAPKKPVA